MTILKKLLCSLLTVTILLGFTLLDFANAKAQESEVGKEQVFLISQEEKLDKELEAYLSENSITYAIENIPDSVLEDPESVVEWFQKHAGKDYEFTTDGENLLIDSKTDNAIFQMEMSQAQSSGSKFQTSGFWTCIGAIGTALVTGVLPIAKITKIKNALKAVGGTHKFVKNLIAHYKFNRKKGWSRSKSYDEAFDRATAKYGKKIKTELGALFGITAIYGACFE
ncbi:hypothetical protein [Bacillus licheniformis]|uniref:hypothetical protein n=1 Tax=Bacillus licheniformis TaxID=1402 RepID=UPI00092C8222|nr:hypothetical protein [Bacillus licheniformis]OJT66450.1 hypothetical protein BFP46_24865 [Bacillus licheniformis]